MRVAASEAGLPASAASCGRAEAGTLEFPEKAFRKPDQQPREVPGEGTSIERRVCRTSASGRAWRSAVTVPAEFMLLITSDIMLGNQHQIPAFQQPPPGTPQCRLSLGLASLALGLGRRSLRSL